MPFIQFEHLEPIFYARVFFAEGVRRHVLIWLERLHIAGGTHEDRALELAGDLGPSHMQIVHASHLNADGSYLST